MKKGEKPSENMSAMSAQTMDQARRAMENYLQFFQKSMSALPWGKTDLSEKIKGYVEKNVATSFNFAQKLTKAKDFQDLVRIQTEFMQTQLETLSEQAKGEALVAKANLTFAKMFSKDTLPTETLLNETSSNETPSKKVRLKKTPSKKTHLKKIVSKKTPSKKKTKRSFKRKVRTLS